MHQTSKPRPGPREHLAAALLWLCSFVVAGLVAILGFYFYLTTTTPIVEPIRFDYSVDDPAFEDSITHLLGPELVAGNKLTTLINGVEIFPAMLDAIGTAEQSITLETYVWTSGKISDWFIAALAERAEAGIPVHVLIDGFGSQNIDDADFEAMADAGIEIYRYKRDEWYKVKLNINHRTHRNTLVIDGRVGFIGGVRISDTWLGDAKSRDRWRDTHYRIEGPAVNQMQGVFVDNWRATTGRILAGELYFPNLTEQNGIRAQVYRSGPTSNPDNARLGHYLPIAGAGSHIRIAHGYFIPDDMSTTLLVEAMNRGVELEIVVPAHSDSTIVRAASRSRWKPLLEAGAKIYEYQPAMFHCKVMIIDDSWVTAGSINFDNRSFAINDESNFNVADAAFASEQIAQFERDKAESILFTLDDYRNRPLKQKFLDAFSGLFRSQL